MALHSRTGAGSVELRRFNRAVLADGDVERLFSNGRGLLASGFCQMQPDGLD